MTFSTTVTGLVVGNQYDVTINYLDSASESLGTFSTDGSSTNFTNAPGKLSPHNVFQAPPVLSYNNATDELDLAFEMVNSPIEGLPDVASSSAIVNIDSSPAPSAAVEIDGTTFNVSVNGVADLEAGANIDYEVSAQSQDDPGILLGFDANNIVFPGFNPVFTNFATSNPTKTTVDVNYEVDYDGAVPEAGVQYQLSTDGTNFDPIAGSGNLDPTGTFTISDLTPETDYYLKGVINGVAIDETITQFRTADRMPEITTANAVAISSTEVEVTYEATFDGEGPNPGIQYAIAEAGGDLTTPIEGPEQESGSFVIPDLDPNTQYSIRL